MNKDIVPELLSDITKAFDSKTKESKVLKEKLTKLKNKKANHLDSNEFAQEVGEILSSVFRENITEDKLPDGKIYYNIVNRVLNSNLKNNYNIINAYAKIVQDELNKKAKISLKAMDAEYSQDRVDGIVESVLKRDDYSSMINDLCSSTENFSRSIVDELIKNNANLHSKAGLKPVIERKMHGGACSFCKTLAGTYDYEETKRLAETDPKKNPFARHRHCRCTVDYVPGNNKKQDIWSKEWRDIDKSDKIKERIEFSYKKPNSKSEVVETAIKKGIVKDEINTEKQSRHLRGSHLPDRSFINGDMDFSKELYREFRGKGKPIIVNNEWKNKERVNTGRIVATYIDDNGKKFDSSNIIIVYSKTGSHILGGRPNES